MELLVFVVVDKLAHVVNSHVDVLVPPEARDVGRPGDRASIVLVDRRRPLFPGAELSKEATEPVDVACACRKAHVICLRRRERSATLLATAPEYGGAAEHDQVAGDGSAVGAASPVRVGESVDTQFIRAQVKREVLSQVTLGTLSCITVDGPRRRHVARQDRCGEQNFRTRVCAEGQQHADQLVVRQVFHRSHLGVGAQALYSERCVASRVHRGRRSLGILHVKYVEALRNVPSLREVERVFAASDRDVEEGRYAIEVARVDVRRRVELELLERARARRRHKSYT